MRVKTVYRAGMRISEWVQGYTSSVEHDTVIAREVVEAAMLHVTMLRESRLLDEETACRLLGALEALRREPGRLIEAMRGYEDIHEALEAVLEELAGREAARSFPLARSRNDHVAMALRLWGLRMLERICREAVGLAETLLRRSEELADAPFPLHTHFQPAQVGTAGHWLASYAEAVIDALGVLAEVGEVTARCTLGSGPAAGTTVPVDRSACPLPPAADTLYATGSRLFANLAIASLAALATELSRFAADVVLLSHPSIGAVRLPDELVSTSSAMPHKRNPVVAEVLRARAARLAGLAAAALAVNHGLPSGYSLDLQEENPVYYQALRDALEALEAARLLAEKLEVDPEAIKRMVEGGAVLTSLEAAEKLTLEKRVPFRDAYMEVAEAVRGSGSINQPSIREVIMSRASLGAAGPGLRPAIRLLRERLSSARERCSKLTRLLASVEERIEEGVGKCRS